MSYINDALRRAQKEKDSRYAAYGAILRQSTDQGSIRNKRRWIAFGAAITLLLAGSLIFIFSARNVMPPAPPPRAERPVVPEVRQLAPSPPSPALQAAVGKNVGRVALPYVSPEDIRRFDPEETYLKALERQKEHRFSEAEALYGKILARDPGHVMSLNNLGVIYLGQGKTTLAAEMFRKAIDKKKDYVDPYYNLACLHVRKHDLREGLRRLKEAAAVDKRVKSWAREDADLRPLRELTEYKSFVEGD